eukprot:gene20-biopygen91
MHRSAFATPRNVQLSTGILSHHIDFPVGAAGASLVIRLAAAPHFSLPWAFIIGSSLRRAHFPGRVAITQRLRRIIANFTDPLRIQTDRILVPSSLENTKLKVDCEDVERSIITVGFAFTSTRQSPSVRRICLGASAESAPDADSRMERPVPWGAVAMRRAGWDRGEWVRSVDQSATSDLPMAPIPVIGQAPRCPRALPFQHRKG